MYNLIQWMNEFINIKSMNKSIIQQIYNSMIKSEKQPIKQWNKTKNNELNQWIIFRYVRMSLR